MSLHKLSLFSECITHTDCPNGGKNYECNANECDCPSPKFLDDNKNCVGMLPFDKKNSHL